MVASTLKTSVCAAAVTALLASFPAAAQNSTRPSATAPAGATTDGKSSGAAAALDRSDRKFVEEAAAGGMAEVELGKLAEQKATSDQVKQFGARMVEDHGKANDELKELAQSKGLSVPAAPDKSHQKDLDKLSKLSGAQFDREYMAHMLSDHRKDVSEFKKMSESAKDSDVKAFAGKTLPTLQEHLKMAQSVNDSVKSMK